jgi:hypothetical protein
MVAIRDAEVATSFANKTITVYYDVQNFNNAAKTVTVNGNVIPSAGGATVLTLATPGTTFASGERKKIQISSPWTNPNLWWPTDPKLYLLCSSVKESATTVDSQTVRFGFREVKINGNHIELNGVRVNDVGESIEPSDGRYPKNAAEMRAWIALQKSVNATGFRFHAKPPANLLVDECDELGMMVEPEAPLWQAPATVVNSAETRGIWYPAYVKNLRNHASIIWWSVANETFVNTLWILADTIAAYDHSNRPVWPEWGDETNMKCNLNHYPELYTQLPKAGSIYAVWRDTQRPYGIGEQLACCGSWGATEPDVHYWHGIYARGERYTYMDLIHNYLYTLQWGWIENAANAVAKKLLANSYARVALFDHDYENLGIAPIKDNAYPSLTAGSTANRNLDLYNDEFSDSVVRVQVDVKSGTTTYATGTRTYNVTLGYHVRVPISFQVPYVGGSTFDMVLTTSKAGVQKFSEAKRFNVTGGSSGTSSSTITFTGGTGTNAPTTMAHSPRRTVTLISGKTVLTLPIDCSGKAPKAAVSIFTMKGNRLCSASASRDNGGALVAAFGSQLPAGNYIVKVSADGQESAGLFYLASQRKD